jgi:enamine deaminase RidA (YjgF/YER057c/UK114 family)
LDISRFEFRDRIHLGVIHNATLYLTGQVGTPSVSVAEQTREALAKIDRLLALAGTRRERILQATVWLDDMRDFAEFNSVWDTWVPKPHAPARSTGQVRMNLGIKVEITIIAAML